MCSLHDGHLLVVEMHIHILEIQDTSQGTNYTHISAANPTRQQASSDRGIFFRSKAQKTNPILISCQRSGTGDICMINAVQSVAVQQS